MKSLFSLILAFSFTCAYAQSDSAELKSILEDTTLFRQQLNDSAAWGQKIFLGKSSLRHSNIYAYYYPKPNAERAMVIAGVHGSEFFGVDVARSVRQKLDSTHPDSLDYCTLLIEEVFPDNVYTARKNPAVNIGRKTCDNCEDPNRQMPPLKKAFQPSDSISNNKAPIERENRYLLLATQMFNPHRIASLHCNNKTGRTGIYADPRTDSSQKALGYENDSLLAKSIAQHVRDKKGLIRGNYSGNRFIRAVYILDTAAVKKGVHQPRSYESKNYLNKISYGTWASTQVVNKQAAITLTYELPHKRDLNHEQAAVSLEAYSSSILSVFLNKR